MTLSAVLVEDEANQADRVSEILRGAGFDAMVFATASSARIGATSARRPVDLVVIDRRLPEGETSEPLDETGDKLLPELIGSWPDTPFVVLTAHADVPHAQWSTRDRGSLVLTEDVHIDRVAHFEKTDYIGFESYVNVIAGRYQHLANMVDVHGVAGDEEDHVILRRLLRKVAVAHGGSSLTAAPLDGGLSSASVFRCDISDDDGVVLATVVVKVRPSKRTTSSGGLHASLPGTVIAGPGPLVRGLCGSLEAQAYQVAGSSTISLMSLLGVDDATAARQIVQLRDAYRSLQRPHRVTKRLADVIAPLVTWSQFAAATESIGLPVPSTELRVGTSEAAQHGDLHPENVLVENGRTILIDFDNETVASAALDPLYLLLSMSFHRASPLRGLGWPTPDEVVMLASGSAPPSSPVSGSLAELLHWLGGASVGGRERWALVAGFAARQMKYDDVIDDERLLDCCQQLLRRAIAELAIA